MTHENYIKTTASWFTYQTSETNYITPSNRVLPKKLRCSQLAKKISRILWIPKIHYCIINIYIKSFSKYHSNAFIITENVKRIYTRYLKTRRGRLTLNAICWTPTTTRSPVRAVHIFRLQDPEVCVLRDPANISAACMYNTLH